MIGRVVRYTNTHKTPIPKLLNDDGKTIDTGQIIITQKWQVRKNDINATMVSWRQLVPSVDKYFTIVNNRLGDSCNLSGIRVPKCTRWRLQTILSATCCQVRFRILRHCSNAARTSCDDAFDGTEEFESAWRDDSVLSSSALIVQNISWNCSTLLEWDQIC